MQNLRLPSFFWTRTTALPMDVQFLDGTNVQHFLEMALHIIIHMRGYALVMLLEEYLVCYFDFVFN